MRPGTTRHYKTRGQVGTSARSDLGAVVADKGSTPEVLSRIAQAAAALAPRQKSSHALHRQRQHWHHARSPLTHCTGSGSTGTSPAKAACETRTLSELDRKVSAVEMRCCRRPQGL
ncbi:hypothetical protein ACOMHN_049130 [Nucella lapillus]